MLHIILENNKYPGEQEYQTTGDQFLSLSSKTGVLGGEGRGGCKLLKFSQTLTPWGILE